MGRHIEPRPKNESPIKLKDRWAVTSIIPVPSTTLDISPSLANVLFQRRTNRHCAPMDLLAVFAFIRLAMQPTQIGEGGNRGRLRKISVSGGALHPVEVLVIAGSDVSEPILYSDTDDIFCTIPLSAPESALVELEALANLVPQASGHFLLFVANKRHADQGYDDTASLLWRDAGAVLQTFSLLAAASGNVFVPLGITGSAILETINTPHVDYVAVGTALIGKAPAHTDAAAL